MDPLVSVIMGVYNQYDVQILRLAVSSILDQTFKNLEFIIWDDGSDKDAADLLKELPRLDDRIILAGREENRGLAFSLNECIRMARGKYIARMDADDISLPERLDKQVSFLESHPEYGWCGTASELFDENGTWGVRIMPEVPSVKDYYRYSPFIHPSVVFRASIFFEENSYSEKEDTLRCEDYEIFMKLNAQGIRGYNLQEILFRYREDSASFSRRNARSRFREARIRFRNYKSMHALFPLGWIHVLRPIAACFVPSSVIRMIKRREGIKQKNKADAKTEIRNISELHSQKPAILRGTQKMPG